MTHDPLARLTTTARLWLGAALCALPLGLVWSTSPGFLTSGMILPGDCGYSESYYCTLDTYIPGAYVPGHHLLGSQAPARVFLVLAALVLAYAAVRQRTAFTKRLVRAATVAMAVALALAMAGHAVSTVLCQLGGLALVAPLVWPGRRRRAVFVPAPRAR